MLFGRLWLHPCLTDPYMVRNLRWDGPTQELFVWGELEGEFCVGSAWGNRDIFPISDFLIFRNSRGL